MERSRIILIHNHWTALLSSCRYIGRGTKVHISLLMSPHLYSIEPKTGYLSWTGKYVHICGMLMLMELGSSGTLYNSVQGSEMRIRTNASPWSSVISRQFLSLVIDDVTYISNPSLNHVNSPCTTIPSLPFINSPCCEDRSTVLCGSIRTRIQSSICTKWSLIHHSMQLPPPISMVQWPSFCLHTASLKPVACSRERYSCGFSSW